MGIGTGLGLTILILACLPSEGSPEVKRCLCEKSDRGLPGVEGLAGPIGPPGPPAGPAGLPGLPGRPGTPGFALRRTGSSVNPDTPGFLTYPEATEELDVLFGFSGESDVPDGSDANALPLPGLKGGSTGLVDESGAPAELCTPGVPGRKGEKGAWGLPGLSGLPGQKGEPGHSGPPGIPGVPGMKGQKGDPGIIVDSVHVEGNKKIVTLRGPAGPPGEIGLPGPNGRDGLDGLLGLPGLPGMKGIKGEPGAIGQVRHVHSLKELKSPLHKERFADLAVMETSTGFSFWIKTKSGWNKIKVN